MLEKKAQIILEVAQAIGTQLEMSDLLAALNNTLKPIVHFDAISILILKGETVTPYWVHVEGLSRGPGESVASLLGRYASRIKVEPPPMTLPVTHQRTTITGEPRASGRDRAAIHL